MAGCPLVTACLSSHARFLRVERSRSRAQRPASPAGSRQRAARPRQWRFLTITLSSFVAENSALVGGSALTTT